MRETRALFFALCIVGVGLATYSVVECLAAPAAIFGAATGITVAGLLTTKRVDQ